MDQHHCDADDNAICSIADIPDIPKTNDLWSSAAKQKDDTSDTATQSFRAKVDQILDALRDVDRIIEKQEDGTLVYKREGKQGKHSIINFDILVNTCCRICNKAFPTAFQARMLCCEVRNDIPWPVLYSGGSETAEVCFPSTDHLVEYLGSMPPKHTLTYFCPFIGCDCESKGSPNTRHINEQHLLFKAPRKKQPILCTIGNCGLYLKRPDEKLREHLQSTHRHETTYTSLEAPTPVLLAALDPDDFYDVGLNYYKEELQYKASMDQVDEEPVAPKVSVARRRSKVEGGTQAPKPASRKKPKIEVEAEEASTRKPRTSCKKSPAPKAPASRKRSVRDVSSKSKTAKEDLDNHEEEENFRSAELKSTIGIMAAGSIRDSSPIDFKLDDGLTDYETSSCEDCVEGPTTSMPDAFFTSFITPQSLCYWCNEADEAEVFDFDTRSFPRLNILSEESMNCGRNSFATLKFDPEFDRFGNLNIWSSESMLV